MNVTSLYPSGPDRPLHGNASPGLDRAEVDDCWRLLGRHAAARAVEEIEGYGANSAEELGALRDLELWGCNPFEEA